MPGPHLLIPNSPWPLHRPFVAALTRWAEANLGPLVPLHKALTPFAEKVQASRATIARLVGARSETVPTPLPFFLARLAEELGVNPDTFLPLGAENKVPPQGIQPPLAEVEGALPEPVNELPVQGARYPLLREPGSLEVISVAEDQGTVRYRKSEDPSQEFEAPIHKFWRAVLHAQAPTVTIPEGYPNRRVIQNTGGIDLDEGAKEPETQEPSIGYLRVTSLGLSGKTLATQLAEAYKLWPSPEAVVVPALITPTVVGGVDRFVVSLPGGVEGLTSLSVTPETLRRCVAPVDSPTGAAAVIRWVHNTMVRMKSQRDDASHSASVGIAAVQDPLLPLREISQGLNHLNDDLKILVIDTQDLADESKDIRNAFVAKRTATLRKSLQAMLKKLGQNS